jgi:hypothetical protein
VSYAPRHGYNNVAQAVKSGIKPGNVGLSWPVLGISMTGHFGLIQLPIFPSYENRYKLKACSISWVRFCPRNARI